MPPIPVDKTGYTYRFQVSDPESPLNSIQMNITKWCNDEGEALALVKNDIQLILEDIETRIKKLGGRGSVLSPFAATKK